MEIGMKKWWVWDCIGILDIFVKWKSIRRFRQRSNMVWLQFLRFSLVMEIRIDSGGKVKMGKKKKYKLWGYFSHLVFRGGLLEIGSSRDIRNIPEGKNNIICLWIRWKVWRKSGIILKSSIWSSRTKS